MKPVLFILMEQNVQLCVVLSILSFYYKFFVLFLFLNLKLYLLKNNFYKLAYLLSFSSQYIVCFVASDTSTF